MQPTSITPVNHPDEMESNPVGEQKKVVGHCGWTSEVQENFLAKELVSYQATQASKVFEEFRVRVYMDWSVRWPLEELTEQDVVSGVTLEDKRVAKLKVS